MTGLKRWWRLGALVAGVLLAAGAGAAPAGGQVIDARDAQIARLQADVADRDALIQAQESLLNVYRCMFDIDTELVPGGCPDDDQPPPTPTPTPTPSPTPEEDPSEDPVEDAEIPEGTIEAQWEQLRECNADGNYQHANPNGANFGVYEFTQATWNRLAGLHHPRLVGVVPNEADPADQDRMAYLLYEEQGWTPWPTCGASLPSLLPGATPTPTPDPSEFPAIPAGTTQEQWDQLIACESGGNYRAYNPAGPYLGAFQFNQATWNGVASRHYPSLVGVDPRDASAADQHRMAYALYGERGWQPWPTCGAPFR